MSAVLGQPGHTDTLERQRLLSRCSVSPSCQCQQDPTSVVCIKIPANVLPHSDRARTGGRSCVLCPHCPPSPAGWRRACGGTSPGHRRPPSPQTLQHHTQQGSETWRTFQPAVSVAGRGGATANLSRRFTPPPPGCWDAVAISNQGHGTVAGRSLMAPRAEVQSRKAASSVCYADCARPRGGKGQFLVPRSHPRGCPCESGTATERGTLHR